MSRNRAFGIGLLGVWGIIAVLISSALAQTTPPHDLRYLAEKPLFAFWLRPSEHLKNPVLASLYNEIKNIPPRSRSQQILLAIPKIDSIVVSFGMGRSAGSAAPMPHPIVIYRLADAGSATTLFHAMTEDQEVKQTPAWNSPIYTHKTFDPPRGNSSDAPEVWKLQPGFTQLNSQSLVQTDNIELMLKALSATAPDAVPRAWSDDFAELSKGQALGLVDLVQFRELMKDEHGPPSGLEALLYNNLKTLWEQADYAFITLDTTNGIQITALSKSSKPEGAQRVKETLDSFIGLVKAVLPLVKYRAEQLNQLLPGLGNTVYAKVEELVDSIKVTQEGTQTKLTLEIPPETFAQLSGILLPGIKSIRTQVMKLHGMNNLRQIGLALHSYHDAHGAFPPAMVLGKDGKTPHSWRVAILPFIEENTLYGQYKFDEPWDSPNNQKVAASIPKLYRVAAATSSPTSTNYVVLTHPDGVFNSTPATQGTALSKIVDGSSQTLLVVETNAEIPWTKPEDLPIVDGQPLPKLGMPGAVSFNTAFCDGSVHTLNTSLKDELLRNLILMKDGNVIDSKQLDPPPASGILPDKLAPVPYPGYSLDLPQAPAPPDDKVPPRTPEPLRGPPSPLPPPAKPDKSAPPTMKP